MTKRRRGIRGTGRLPELRGPAGERGMILVLTLIVLLVLSMLAGASLINGLLQRGQARAEANAAIALHAAEAGAAAGMAWLSDQDNLVNVPDPYTADPGWQEQLSGSLANGGSYAVTLRFKRERRDRNADGDCCDTYPDVPVDEASEFRDGDSNSCADCPGDVVLYNQPKSPPDDGYFGFADSYYSGDPGEEGFPIAEIESVGTHGATAVREVALFVARNHKAQVEGAFTSRGSVSAGGSSLVDGTNYNSAGTGPGSCGSDQPGITVDVGATAPPCGANVVGDPCTENFDPNAPGKRELGTTPWDVLGMTEADFNGMFTPDATSTTIPQPCSATPYYLWFKKESTSFNNSSGCTSYSGILVVHNEGFNAADWAVKCPVDWNVPNADGGHADQYDPDYCSDPQYQPATFTMNGNVRWTGIVVADQVMLVNGTPEIIGGVISLATDHDSPSYTVTAGISGNISIKYSCDAVAAVTKRIGYKKKIGWQRVR